MPRLNPYVDLFIACAEAINADVLIRRASSKDKEFHFQDWVGARIREAGLASVSSGRNSYPDFTLVDYPEGYEVKGLATPGREATYDSNSRVPTGLHDGRAIYYVFGRYPAKTNKREYAVIDLVVCHGDLLSAAHDYVHKNKSFRGFGSFGDLQVRDRKMYVAPTPFALANGTGGHATLITPAVLDDDRLTKVGSLARVEAEKLAVSYSFDLLRNTLTPEFSPNPSAGVRHEFNAYRLHGSPPGNVSLKDLTAVPSEIIGEDE